MSKYIGRLVEIGIAKESSRGAGANPAIWLPKVELSVADKTEDARDEASIGALEDSLGKDVVEKYAGGSIRGQLRSDFIGYILLNMLGAVNTSGSSTYTHAFSLSHTNTHQSLSMDIKDPNSYDRYKLAMLDSMSIESELGDYVMFESEFISKVGQAFTEQTPSYSDEGRFTKEHVKVKVANDIASLSGASVLSLKKVAVTISKNLIRDSALGTVQPEDILNRQFSVEGEIQLNLTDDTWRDYMLNGSHKAMEIKLDNGTQSLTIQMPRVDFSGWEPDRANDEIVTQTINFRANRDLANDLDSISTCSLVNTKASY